MRKGGAGRLEITILLQFLAIELHFVRNRVAWDNLGDRTSFRAKGLRRTRETRGIAILPQFLTIEPHFVRKGCAGQLANRNFTSVFGDRTSFRAKGLRGTTCKSQFYFSFWRSNLISCDRVARDKRTRNFTKVFGDRTSFRAKGLRFLPSRWHGPAPSREN